jgi:hypothetical protein
MRALSASEMIVIWERGAAQHPVDRALTLLEACCGEPRERLAQASIGQRDALLLLVHQQLFGDVLQAFAECPQCRERLEYSLSTREIAARSSQSDGSNKDESHLSFTDGEMQLQLRLPNSFDLGAVAACTDMATARRLLAERCVIEMTRERSAVPVSELTDSAVDQIAAHLASADPQGDVVIDLTCAACKHSWQVILEIESFLWIKISALAKRLLRDVHALARAYGWTEQQILSLSPLRRHAYLEMVG